MGSIDRRDSTPQLLNRLRMRQIALLLAVDECSTLRAAAEQMGLTQPAATKMLAELESALGQRLFDRIGRGLVLNPAGERVLGYFRGIRGSMEALNRELGELQLGSAGRLAIGSIMAASPGRLTEALVQLKARYPLLAIDIAVDTSDRLMPQLREGVLEVVIGRNAGTDCDFRVVDDEALAIIAGRDHPLAGAGPVGFDALLDYTWILQPAGSPAREVVEREFQARHQPMPRGMVETGSILTTMNLVDRSTMLGVIPLTVAQRNAEHGLVAIIDYALDQRLPSYGSIVRRDRPLSIPAQQFLALFHREGAAEDDDA
ncbi:MULTISPECIES: LysR family transcriptional regulator [Burkholderia cepacia complex]|uniref:LysR family transcriptional regulator n=1 Tax=Burkholderia stabilis TaxID=95485 RepID=A0A1Y1BT36_9BURK|nr:MULTISPECIES: LysR family transcriptional regulator [Burkholderia cepacia complex]AKM02639.1 LysR family transcriptional regulator [Burkholderia pyrrocinia]BAX63140.1 LysR family transcriptional regulator [Burkholderia stabilis]